MQRWSIVTALGVATRSRGGLRAREDSAAAVVVRGTVAWTDNLTIAYFSYPLLSCARSPPGDLTQMCAPIFEGRFRTHADPGPGCSEGINWTRLRA